MIRANWKRAVGLLLVLLLLITPLVACGQRDVNEEEEFIEEPIDMGKDIAGIGAMEVVIEIDDMPVLWEELYYHLQSTRNMLEHFAPVEDWNAVYEENFYGEPMTYNEFLLRYAIDRIMEGRAVEWLFHDLDLEIDEDLYFERRDLHLEIQDLTEEEYLDLLWSDHLTEDAFITLFHTMLMHDEAMYALYGVDGETVPQEEIDAFAESNEILRAKHILLSTRGDDGQDLPEEEQAEVTAQAEAFYQELQALTGEEQMERFDEILAEFGEDPGMLSNPGGYVFAPGVMVQEFFDGTLALDYGEISPPIRSAFGYHIILRLPVEGDQMLMRPGANPEPVQALVAIERMESILETVHAELMERYRTTPLFERIVPSEIFAIMDEAEEEAYEENEEAEENVE